MDNYLSTIRVPLDKIPEAKRWKVGGKYQITANIEQTGLNKERDYSDEIGPMPTSESRKAKPKYKTFVEFKVYDISAAKTGALNKKTKYQ